MTQIKIKGLTEDELLRRGWATYEQITTRLGVPTLMIKNHAGRLVPAWPLSQIESVEATAEWQAETALAAHQRRLKLEADKVKRQAHEAQEVIAQAKLRQEWKAGTKLPINQYGNVNLTDGNPYNVVHVTNATVKKIKAIDPKVQVAPAHIEWVRSSPHLKGVALLRADYDRLVAQGHDLIAAS